jgi:hypothetical protein
MSNGMTDGHQLGGGEVILGVRYKGIKNARMKLMWNDGGTAWIGQHANNNVPNDTTKSGIGCSGVM